MTHYVMGVHCIDELIKHAPQRIKKIFTTKNLLQRDFAKKLNKENIPIVIKGKNELSDLVKSDSHQSIVALVENPQTSDLKKLLKHLQTKEKACLLLLDNINDPHNLGAIFRAADCFNVDAIIWSKNRGVNITPVVSKVSSGASEFISSIKISNLAQTVSMLQDEGFDVVASAINSTATSLFEFNFQNKTAIILGSEGQGIQPLVLKKANQTLYIPMFGKIDSLNVSQATAVILSYFARLN
jgi:23S rRNA (guanosine2251-2'-O)-methyltransferase